MEWLDLTIRIFVVGLAAWAIRWGTEQRIQAIADKIPDCNSEQRRLRKEIMEEVTNELTHVRELIEKDLEHGAEIFKAHTKAIEKIQELINAINVSIAEIARNGRS